jgi:ABC-type multidrug transport system ATPase subunit
MNIDLQNVTHNAGGQIVLDDLSLHIPSGQRCVIAGPNGSGKTTLLRMLAGLVLPDKGRISLSDRVVAESGKNIVPPASRGISLVFQDLGLWAHLSVKKHLQIAASGSGLHGDADINHMLQACDLVTLAGRCPSTLSGGEQQRLALARSLIGKPGILLLDEAFASLDVLQQQGAVELVRNRLEDQPATLLVVAHHFAEIRRLQPHRIIFLNGGRISADVMVETLDTFRGSAPFIQAWLGHDR